MARTHLTVPPSARRGEVIEVRTLIAHPMETGYRPGADGQILPRDIIRRFRCVYEDQTVFSAELHPAVAANPYLAFHLVVRGSGPLRFIWEGDGGFRQEETVRLNVT